MSSEGITVLFPIFKEPTEEIYATLRSLSRQTLLPRKIIMIDDCPGYRSSGFAHKISIDFPNLDIFYRSNEANLGLAASLNQFLDDIETDFFSRVDCGDVQHKNRFELQLQALVNERNLALIGSQIVCAQTGKISRFPESARKAALMSKFATSVAHPTYMVRTESVVGISYPNIRLAQDYGFLLRLAKKGLAFRSLGVPLVENVNTAAKNSQYKRHQDASLFFQMAGMNNIAPIKRILVDAEAMQKSKGLVLVGALGAVFGKALSRVVALLPI